MKEYKHFRTLYSLSDPNIRTTKKLERMLEKEALAWFEQFGAKFGRTGSPGLWWHYYGSCLEFGHGDRGHRYFHLVKEYHYAIWKTPSFLEGIAYANTPNCHAKDSPYSETDMFNSDAWFWGFSLGRSGYTLESFLELFTQ